MRRRSLCSSLVTLALTKISTEVRSEFASAADYDALI